MGCQATASIDIQRQLLVVRIPHSHESSEHEIAIINFKNELKETAGKSSKPNRQIFNEVSRNHPPEVATQVCFPQIVRGMTNRKAENYPPIPASVDQFVFSLISAREDLKKYYQCSVYYNGSIVGSLFFSSGLVARIPNFNFVCYDGTFFIVPKIFAQLFIICVRQGNRFIPVFFILMTSKHFDHYKAVLEKIKDLVPRFCPEVAIGDFEKGSLKAWKESFPGISMQGCVFHFKQAIMRKLGSLHLKGLYKNRTANCFFKLLMNIGFLPQDKILEGFEILKNYRVGNATQRRNLELLLAYFERFWLSDLSLISWFNSEILTNNFSETFNKSLKCAFNVHHSNPWLFCEKLGTIIYDMELESARIANGLTTTQQRNPDTLQTV